MASTTPTALTLSLDAYRDKVLGGWTGKSIGLTLGAAQRGQTVPGYSRFYSPVPGQPVASIALDFPLVWLAILEEAGPDVSPEDLAVGWLEHLDYQEDEFGYAALNLRRGLPPPASGAHSNPFRHGDGAIFRADFWAMIAPGNPHLAAAYAYHDAKLDHVDDGIWAAMFLAALGSAAFFLDEPLMLLTIGLAMIPRTCRTARAIKAALAAGQRGASWLEARESILKEVGHPNYTDVAQNMGFFTLGLLYGGNDWGEAVCSSVNCGYDSEIVGGAIGAVRGILAGRANLPENWTQPIGDIVIPGLKMRDFSAPRTLTELAKRTVAVGRRIAGERIPDLTLVEGNQWGMDGNEGGIEGEEKAEEERQKTEEGKTGDERPEIEENAPDENAASNETETPNDEAVVLEPAFNVGAAVAEELRGEQTTAEVSAPDASGEITQDAGIPQGETMSHTELVENVAESVLPDENAAQSNFSEPTETTEPTERLETPPLEVAQSAELETPAPPIAETQMSETAPPEPSAPENGERTRDWSSAIAWADSTLVKPLIVTPPNALVEQVGPFEITLDTGDAPTIAYSQPKTLLVSVRNRGEAFNGQIALTTPPGWQILNGPNSAQRQYMAAGQGTWRGEFTLRANEAQAAIDIANKLTLRFTPESGAPLEAEFLLMGAACWWTVGTFANFDGEGFDRSFPPEDRPGRNETYLSRNLQSIRWEKQAFSDVVLDLEPLFRGSSGVLYGQTIFRSPVPMEARLVANTNSGVKVWLNGAQVLRRFHRETFRPQLGGGPWAINVSLHQGDNLVLVKIVRGSEPIQFSLTLSDREGRGLPDVGNTHW